MDQKSWRKRPTAVNSEAGISINGNKEEKFLYNKRLESKYTEARKKLANLTIENGQVTKAFVKKEELIENISNQMYKATTEYQVLKREMKIRTLSADVANRQHKESTSLEAERKRLRLLVKKRVPGHVKRISVDKRTNLMIKKLCEFEEENRTLKESLCERENEIRILKEESERNSEAKILELENKIVCLEMEVERVNESIRTTEDEFEDLKLMNVDLDYQLCGAKFEIKEAFRKVSVLEMELEEKSQQYERLETTCLDLQLQLATVSCDKELTQHSSLRDILNSPTIKDILTKDPSVPHYNTSNNSCGVKNVVRQALPIVPRVKHSKGIGLLWKLLLRRKKGGNKKKLRRFVT